MRSHLIAKEAMLKLASEKNTISFILVNIIFLFVCFSFRFPFLFIILLPLPFSSFRLFFLIYSFDPSFLSVLKRALDGKLREDPYCRARCIRVWGIFVSFFHLVVFFWVYLPSPLATISCTVLWPIFSNLPKSHSATTGDEANQCSSTLARGRRRQRRTSSLLLIIY